MTEMSPELKQLYPFLNGQTRAETATTAVLMESVHQKAADSAGEKLRFFTDNAAALVEFSAGIAQVYASGGRMFSMGNGGSNCDAAHFAVEFQHPATTGRPALPAMNLGTDTALLTALANDVGFDQVFVRQLDAHARDNDGLIGFSTSGNSGNLIEAYRKAKELGLKTFGMSGGDGGKMLQCHLVDYCLVVKTDSIHRVQEVHVTAYHIIWDLVHTLLADQRGKLGAKTDR